MDSQDKAGRHRIPGKDASFWFEGIPEREYPRLEGDYSFDVAVIGGGAAGIAVAACLKEAGFTVALVEARRLLHGVTGGTTAKVTSQHRLVYADLIRHFGREKAGRYALSNQAAVGKIASLVTERRIDCDFEEVPFFVYARDDNRLQKVEQEVEAADSLGLPAAFSTGAELAFNVSGVLRMENQARFHPVKFFSALAGSIAGNKSYVFEGSRVIRLEHGKVCTIVTDRGSIKARFVVVATNSPIFDKEGGYFARLHPHRSYALAAHVTTDVSDAMFIDADPDGYALRFQPAPDGGWLAIISGGNHTPGHPDDTTRYYKALADHCEELYPGAVITHSWSAQDVEAVDRVPYIGRLEPLHGNVYVATGFAKWGMTSAFVAGELLADLLQEKQNPDAELYNPLRFHADASVAKKLLSENTHVIEMFMKERIKGVPEIKDLAPGEGRVGDLEGRRVAVSRDEEGVIHKVSPNCTHMGCVLHWNNAEMTWDCPCHGSRFDNLGRVIQSPANKDLKREPG